MIFSLLRRKKANYAVVVRQYETITDAARHPVFYTGMGVPDTVMGRFEMVCVHLVLYFRRTRGVDGAAASIAQEIMDAFFEDMDHSIRELGVGDAGVPKRMKKIGRMFFGRARSYEEALEANDLEALAEALGRNIYPDPKQKAPKMEALAAYAASVASSLDKASLEEIESGTVSFSPPGKIAGEPIASAQSAQAAHENGDQDDA